MAFPTKDGKRTFGSAFRTKKYDSFHGPEAAAEPAEKKSPVIDAAQGKEEGAAEQGENNPQAVVAEHGPAHTVITHHDHETGKHKVVSHHKDGHMHESEHGTSDEAHEHGKQLAKSDMDEAEGAEQGAESEDHSFMPEETA